MKHIICETCGEYISVKEPIWRVDSVYEQEYTFVCQKCAELYHGYPEALKRLNDDEKQSLKSFDIISDWRSKK